MSFIASLDRRLTLERPSVARDSAYGAELVTFVAVATVWGRLVERAAAEATAAEQRVMARQITVRIRWRADVQATWRITLGARRLQIQGTREAGRRRWLDIDCEETSDA